MIKRFFPIYIFGIFCLASILYMEITLFEGKHIKSSYEAVRDLGGNSAYFCRCKNKAEEIKSPWPGYHLCQNWGFRGEPGQSVALASYPGSGNTWTRYLLQQATGFYTGSIYVSKRLTQTGFPGEGIVNSSVIAVKTHAYGPNARQPYDKAILLVRDPAEALLSFFNYKTSGQTGHATPNQMNERLASYVAYEGDQWLAMNMDWLKNFNKPLLVVRYTDLKKDLEHELRRMSDFLDVPIRPEVMGCILEHKQGLFKREKKGNQADFLTEEMKTKLKGYENQVEGVLKDMESNGTLSQ